MRILQNEMMKSVNFEGEPFQVSPLEVDTLVEAPIRCDADS